MSPKNMIPDESNPIRVFIADDHPTMRMGLRILLEQAKGICVVGESGEGHDAINQIKALHPDVAVLDCQLPGLDGIQVAVEIWRQAIPTKVIALSSYSEERYIRGMLEAGVLGYLLKDEAPERIIDAVRAAARGEGRFSAKVTRQFWTSPQSQRKENQSAALTAREKQIVQRIAQGMTNKMIGKELGVSDKAIEKHVSIIFEKWHVKSRSEIAARAAREE